MRARVALVGSGGASDLAVTDFETGELTTEMAGFTCATAVTENATLRIAAAKIEIFIFLPFGSNRLLGELGAPHPPKPCSLRGKLRTGAISLILNPILPGVWLGLHRDWLFDRTGFR